SDSLSDSVSDSLSDSLSDSVSDSASTSDSLSDNPTKGDQGMVVDQLPHTGNSETDSAILPVATGILGLLAIAAKKKRRSKK
ncbi:LPXTG cell wall anchor domain-containing protein, partial [Fructobacillus pseudoficulneus]